MVYRWRLYLYRVLSTDSETKAGRALAQDKVARARHRHAWTTAVTQATSMKVADLRAKAGAAYAWLRRHNHEWLSEHLPKRRTNKIRPRVDWVERDLGLAERVASAAREIRSRPDRVRATRNEILRSLSCATTWWRCRARLPALCAALDAHSESLDDYRRRCAVVSRKAMPKTNLRVIGSL